MKEAGGKKLCINIYFEGKLKIYILKKILYNRLRYDPPPKIFYENLPQEDPKLTNLFCNQIPTYIYIYSRGFAIKLNRKFHFRGRLQLKYYNVRLHPIIYRINISLMDYFVNINRASISRRKIRVFSHDCRLT